MSETTKKTTAATGSKRSRATAKTVDKSATEQAPQTEPNAVVVQDGAEQVTDKGATEPAPQTESNTVVVQDGADQVVDNKPNESTPETPATGEADKPEQSTATKAGSETKGEEDAGIDQGSTGVGGADNDLGDGTTGNGGTASNAVGGSGSTSSGVDSSNATALGDQVKGAFEVTAKSDAGFWRSGVKFHRLEKTLVLVAKEGVEDIKGIDQLGYQSDRVVCLSPENAKRIHSEQNLVVTDLDFDELVQSSLQA